MNRIFGIIMASAILAATLSSSFQIIAASAYSDPGTGNRAEKAPVIVSGGLTLITFVPISPLFNL